MHTGKIEDVYQFSLKLSFLQPLINEEKEKFFLALLMFYVNIYFTNSCCNLTVRAKNLMTLNKKSCI